MTLSRSQTIVPLASAVALAIGCLLMPRPAGAAIFANFDSVRQERFLAGGFTQNPSFFLLDKYDVSGIAVDTTVGTVDPRGGALISQRHVVTAWHYQPGAFTFHGNDGALHTYNVAPGGYTRLNTTFIDEFGNTVTRPSDVAIARLEVPINPAHGINPLPIVGSDASEFQNHYMYAMGQNNQGGSNRVEDDVLVVTRDGSGNISSATHTVRFDFDPLASGNAVNGEIGLIGGDSGNPALLVASGRLALIGAHFAIDTANPGPGVNYNNFSSYLGAYLDPLNTIVTGDGYDLTVVPIPEPTGVLVLAGGAGVSLLRRRRKVA